VNGKGGDLAKLLKVGRLDRDADEER